MPLPGISACDRCGHELQADWRVCPACAQPLDDATRTNIGDPPQSSSGVEEGRFPVGTVLAGRYKILGLIGRGGMGEVYRAFDQILNQAVALKFVAAAGELDEAALNRFRNEVRVARQVSHPNVCRVYDIGFVEGMHFLSMEYLDGENLGSLLRRIGRLPQDKATEFARKICAGLAAAHERGVLHRDLKPANIMIDGRGQVRITDFGLAAFAKEISSLHSRGLRDPLVASHLLAGLTAGLVFERVVLNGAWAFLSPALGLFGVSQHMKGALASPERFVALPLGLFLGLMLLIFVVLVRRLTRRLWVADAAGALVFSVLGFGLISPVVGPVIMFLGCVAWLWVLRRFGLFPVMVIFGLFSIRWMPSVLDGWLATPSIVLHSIPVALAAVAMWVIIASRSRPTVAAAH